jgi:hypothetical protein
MIRFRREARSGHSAKSNSSLSRASARSRASACPAMEVGAAVAASWPRGRRLLWPRGRRLRWPWRQHGATHSRLWPSPSGGGVRADHPTPHGATSGTLLKLQRPKRVCIIFDFLPVERVSVFYRPVPGKLDEKIFTDCYLIIVGAVSNEGRKGQKIMGMELRG